MIVKQGLRWQGMQKLIRHRAQAPERAFLVFEGKVMDSWELARDNELIYILKTI